MLSVRVDADAFLRDFERLERNMADAGAHAWAATAQQAARFMVTRGYKNRTGNLSASMGERTVIGGSFRYRSDVGSGLGGKSPKYAIYVDQGTRPHKITAVNAKCLHFFWHGKEWFRLSVWHPGTYGAFFTHATGVVFGHRFSDNLDKALDAVTSRA